MSVWSIHTLEFVASFQKRPYLMRCSPPQAHWLCDIELQIVVIAPCDHAFYQSLYIRVWTDMEGNYNQSGAQKSTAESWWSVIVLFPHLFSLFQVCPSVSVEMLPSAAQVHVFAWVGFYVKPVMSQSLFTRFFSWSRQDVPVLPCHVWKCFSAHVPTGPHWHDSISFKWLGCFCRGLRRSQQTGLMRGLCFALPASLANFQSIHIQGSR